MSKQGLGGQSKPMKDPQSQARMAKIKDLLSGSRAVLPPDIDVSTEAGQSTAKWYEESEKRLSTLLQGVLADQQGGGGEISSFVWNETPLSLAIQNGHVDAFPLLPFQLPRHLLYDLLDSSSPIAVLEAILSQPGTPLYEALDYEDFEFGQYTPLQKAMHKGDAKFLGIILTCSRGRGYLEALPVDARPEDEQWMYMAQAVMSYNAPELIDHLADLSPLHPLQPYQAAMLAIRFNRAEVVQMLVDKSLIHLDKVVHGTVKGLTPGMTLRQMIDNEQLVILGEMRDVLDEATHQHPDYFQWRQRRFHNCLELEDYLDTDADGVSLLRHYIRMVPNLVLLSYFGFYEQPRFQDAASKAKFQQMLSQSRVVEDCIASRNYDMVQQLLALGLKPSYAHLLHAVSNDDASLLEVLSPAAMVAASDSGKRSIESANARELLRIATENANPRMVRMILRLFGALLPKDVDTLGFDALSVRKAQPSTFDDSELWQAAGDDDGDGATPQHTDLPLYRLANSCEATPAGSEFSAPYDRFFATLDDCLSFKDMEMDRVQPVPIVSPLGMPYTFSTEFLPDSPEQMEIDFDVYRSYDFGNDSISFKNRVRDHLATRLQRSGIHDFSALELLAGIVTQDIALPSVRKQQMGRKELTIGYDEDGNLSSCITDPSMEFGMIVDDMLTHGDGTVCYDLLPTITMLNGFGVVVNDVIRSRLAVLKAVADRARERGIAVCMVGYLSVPGHATAYCYRWHPHTQRNVLTFLDSMAAPIIGDRTAQTLQTLATICNNGGLTVDDTETPLIPIQHLVETKTGYDGACSYWSTFLAHCVLLNPSIDVTQLLICLLVRPWQQVMNILRMYIAERRRFIRAPQARTPLFTMDASSYRRLLRQRLKPDA